MNKKNLILSVLGFGVVALVGIWYFIFWQPTHSERNLGNEEAIVINPSKIVKEFQTNEDVSFKKYQNKVVEVTGKITEIKKNQDGFYELYFETGDAFNGLHCTLKDKKPIELKAGTEVTAKGILNGFLSDVIIIEAIITKP